MSFWDRIKRRLTGKPVPVQTTYTPPVKPRPATVSRPENATADTVPTPATTLDTFQLLLSNKDKHTTHMLNSITLSSDMNTLYLIDNNRAIPFDLTAPEGVLVGLLSDQLVVATGKTATLSTDSPDIEGPITISDGPTRTGGKTYTFKAVQNSQYTLSYNGRNKALGVIGTVDIVLDLQAPNENNCNQVFTSLDNRRIVKIQRVEDELRITELGIQ